MVRPPTPLIESLIMVDPPPATCVLIESVAPSEMVDGVAAEPSVSDTPVGRLLVMNRPVPPKVIGPVRNRLWYPVGSSPAVAFAVIKPKFIVMGFAIVRSAPIGLKVGGGELSMETVPVPNGPAVDDGPGSPLELAAMRKLVLTPVSDVLPV